MNLFGVVKYAQALEYSVDDSDKLRHVFGFTLGDLHNLAEIAQVAVLCDYDQFFNTVLHLLKRLNELDDVAAAELVEPVCFFFGHLECFGLAVHFRDE